MKLFKGTATVVSTAVATAGVVAITDLRAHGATFYLAGGTAAVSVPASLTLLLAALAGLRILSRRRRADAG